MSTASTLYRRRAIAFVVSDRIYEGLLRQIQNSSKAVWSKDPPQLNTLKDGKIMRLDNGQWKPVYKASEQKPKNTAMIHHRLCLDDEYINHLKNFPRVGIPFPLDVKIHFDAPTYNCYKVTLPTEEDWYTLVEFTAKQPTEEDWYTRVEFTAQLLANP